jgi:integrase/recombinase XerD
MNALELFKLYITSEKGLSPKTIEAYLNDLKILSDFYPGRDLVSLKEEELIGFFLVVRQKSASSTLRRRFMAIKVFYKFLQKEGLLQGDPFKFLTSPKMKQMVPLALGEEEMTRLLAQPDLSTPLGLRDKAILEILYGAGLRVSELVGLTLYSVDEEGVRVMGKGGKERVVPIGKQAIHALDRYLASRINIPEREDPLFLNQKGRAIDRIEVWEIVKKHAKEAGLGNRISPHTLRHTYASHLLDRGADIRVIQELLGHGAISSTERYTQISLKQLKEKFKRFHPAGDGT